MDLNVDALVGPLSDDQPSGPDFYGHLERLQIEQAFDRSISDGASSDITAAQWQDTIDLILKQCDETRDLWLPVYLMRAAAQAGQFDLVVQASTFLAALIETRWADVHPQLEDLGYIGRKTPVESLTRIGDFLGPLERVPLVIHPRLGAYSGADFERFREKGAKADGFGEFRQTIDSLGAEHLEQVLGAIDAMAAAIRSVDGTLTTHADGDTATNFKPTNDVLAKMRKAVATFLPKPVKEATVSEAPPSQSGTETPATSSGYTGMINSREDVATAIDAICAYYARFEPGSPVPFVLRRARDWISLDFIAVLEDIAPGSLDEATRVLKSQKAETAVTGDWGNTGSDEAQSEEQPPSETGDGWG